MPNIWPCDSLLENHSDADSPTPKMRLEETLALIPTPPQERGNHAQFPGVFAPFVWHRFMETYVFHTFVLIVEA